MTRKSVHSAASVTFASAVVALAQTAPSHEDRTLPIRPVHSAATLLAKHVESVEWTEITLDEVIDWLRDLGGEGINVLPQWTALATVGVAPDSSVRLTLADTIVADVLNEVLRQLAPHASLGYHAERNYLRISTNQDLNEEMFLRVYNASDLVSAVPDFGEEAPRIDLQQAGQSAGTGAGQSVFSSGSGAAAGGAENEQATQDELTRLRDAIVTMIAPDSWGGPFGAGRGRITAFRRSLLVYNTAEVHEQIAGAFFRGE